MSPADGRMYMNLSLHQENLLRHEMTLSELMRRRSEVWESTRKIDSFSGYPGSKNAWIEDRQALIRRRIGVKKGPKITRKIGGMLPFLLIGEPGSGKTTLGKQLLYKTLYKNDEEDISAPMASYEDTGEAEIPIIQWTFEWGDACALIEDSVPDGIDYLENDYWRMLKIREIMIASELFGSGLEMMAELADNRSLDILLIDAPGGTIIDRATPQLSDFVNKTGSFADLNYMFPQIIGLVASENVLSANREVRAGMYDYDSPREKIAYLKSKGVVIDAVSEAAAAETVERYAKGSANPQQIEMILGEVSKYQELRMRAHRPADYWEHIPFVLEMYRKFPSVRQHDLAHLYLPDYFSNILKLKYPTNSMIMSNEVQMPQVEFPAEVGSHDPLTEIAGFTTEMKERARKRLENNSHFHKMGFTL